MTPKLLQNRSVSAISILLSTTIVHAMSTVSTLFTVSAVSSVSAVSTVSTVSTVSIIPVLFNLLHSTCELYALHTQCLRAARSVQSNLLATGAEAD